MAAFTYDPATDRGEVRMLLADTRAETGVFDDAEIDAALSRQGSVEGAVYQLAAFMYSHAIRHSSQRAASNQRGSESVNDTHQPQHWRALMETYRPFAAVARRLPTVTATVSAIPSDDGYDLC